MTTARRLREDPAMPRYTVHMIQTVSTSIPVEADTPADAVDAAYESPDMPGSMTIRAFGDASVDESGEWEAMEVTDWHTGKTVWTDDPSGVQSDASDPSRGQS